MAYFKHVFTRSDYVAAQARINKAALNKHSYLGPEGQLRGTLGEIAFEKFLMQAGLSFNFVNSTQYDYEVVFPTKTVKVDVKTKARNFELRGYFEGSIPDYVAEHQKYDFAAFVSLLTGDGAVGALSFQSAEIGGFADKALLNAKGVSKIVGVDSFGSGNNKCKISCTNINFNEMLSIDEWLAGQSKQI